MTAVAASQAPRFRLSRIKMQLMTVMLLGFLATSIVLSVTIGWHMQQVMPQELAGTQAKVAEVVAGDVQRAISYGIPLEQMRGIDDLFESHRRARDEIGYMVMTDAQGGMIAHAGTMPAVSALAGLPLSEAGAPPVIAQTGAWYNLAMPVVVDGTQLATIHIGVGFDYVRRLIVDRMFDVLTVLLVITIVSTEVLLLFLDVRILRPLLGMERWAEAVRERQPGRLSRIAGDIGGFLKAAHAAARQILAGGAGSDAGKDSAPHWQIMLRYVRVSLFIFVLADSMSLSFLPLYSKELLHGRPHLFGWSEHVLIGLPVAAYWLVSAVVQLPGASLLERMPHRVMFLVAAAASALGQWLAAQAVSLESLMAARVVSALGFGLIFMTCQAAILTHVPSERRTLGIGMFTGVFFLGTFSGTALGGVVAQELGFRPTFLFAGIISVMAGMFAILTYGESKEAPPKVVAGARRTLGEYVQLGKNLRFISLLALCAIPNRTFNVALLFYLAPLYLTSLDSTKSEIGRMISAYGLIMAFGAPVLARWVDARKLQVSSVISGTLMVGGGALALSVIDSSWGLLLTIVMMGVGQALSIPSQVSLIPVVGARNADSLGLPRLFGVFRVGERIPAFAGPVVAATLVGLFGYTGAIAAYGTWLFVSGALLALVFMAGAGGNRRASAMGEEAI